MVVRDAMMSWRCGPTAASDNELAASRLHHASISLPRDPPQANRKQVDARRPPQSTLICSDLLDISGGRAASRGGVTGGRTDGEIRRPEETTRPSGKK